MPLAINVPGATFTQILARVPPNLAKSYGLFFLGGDATASGKNYAGGANLSVVGAPAYSANSATLSPTAGFRGVTNRTSPFTLMGVFSVGTGNGRYLGYSTDGIAGASIQRSNATVLGVLTGNSRVVSGANSWAGTAPKFVALSHDGANTSIYLGAAGALAKNTAAYAATPVANPLSIGALGGVGTLFEAFCAQDAQLLSDAEILASYLYMQFALAKKGVAVA